MAKFDALRKVYPQLVQADQSTKEAEEPESGTPAAYSLREKKNDLDTLKEFKAMVKTLLLGLKNVIYVLLTVYNTGSSHQANPYLQVRPASGHRCGPVVSFVGLRHCFCGEGQPNRFGWQN